MGEAESGDPQIEEPPAIEHALTWIKTRIRYFLQIRPESASVDFIETAEGRRIILDFIREPARRRLIIFSSNTGEIKVEFDLPSGFYSKAAYFLKQRSFSVGEDGSMSGLLMGELDANILEHLSLVSHEILQPLLLSGRTKDPELIGKDTMDVFHRFLSKLFVTVGQTQGKTLLPLPPPDLNYKDALEQRMLKDKERLHVLESCVINWTQQIKNVLRHEPPSYIRPGDLRTGTMAEFTFWRNRARDLSSIEDQLKNNRIQKVLKVLEATKSTYEKPFQKLVREVGSAAKEACDIDLHLRPLEKLLETFAETSFDTLGPMFRPALHTINLIFSHSNYYNTGPRLQSVLEKLNNNVIHAALKYVNGSCIFSLQPEQSEQRLLTAIQLFGQLRTTYQAYKARSAQTQSVWQVQDELVFSLPDQFVERCHDMIDLVQVASRFGALKSVQVSCEIRSTRTIEQINAEFHEALLKIRNTGYDLLDIAATKYDNDFFEFRRTVRDCEKRLGNIIAERLDAGESSGTLQAAFSFLSSFEVMLDRKMIMGCLQERSSACLASIEAELRLVHHAFVEGSNLPKGSSIPLQMNMPTYAGRIYWCRSLANRLRPPLESAQRMLKPIMTSEAGKQVQASYETLLASLEAYEARQITSWNEEADLKLAEKLKQPLLIRDSNGKTLHVNFDSGIWALLREAKYLQQLNVTVPAAVKQMYTKADLYQQHAGNLQLIVNGYNKLISSMTEEEWGLMQGKVEMVDEALEEGIEHLNWRNHSIASFIKKTTSYIADASALLQLLHSNSNKIVSIIKSWSTANLHTPRKKTVQAEDYVQWYRGMVDMRFTVMRDEAALIHNLISEIYLALHVSRGDAAWKQYIAHMNSVIATSLRNVTIESLRAIRETIDPSEFHKSPRLEHKGEAGRPDSGPTQKSFRQSLVEVRLELVVPDILLQPEAGANAAGTGLQDLVDLWNSCALSIASRLPRIDSGDGDYTEDVTNHPDVLQLIEDIRLMANSTLQTVHDYKGKFEDFNFLWVQEPNEEFQKFLASQSDNADEVLRGIEEALKVLKETETQIKGVSNRETIAWISVDAKPIKQALFTLLSKWVFCYTHHLVQELLLQTEEMQNFLEHANKKLRAYIEEEDERLSTPLSEIMGIITSVRKKSKDVENLFGPWVDKIELLKQYGVELPAWVLNHVLTAPQQWNALKKRMFQCRTTVEPHCVKEEGRLHKENMDLLAKASAYRTWFLTNMPFSIASLQATDLDAAYDALDSQRKEKSLNSDMPLTLEVLKAEFANLNQQEDLFDLPPTEHPAVQQCTNELLLLKKALDFAGLVDSAVRVWREIGWKGADMVALKKEAQALMMVQDVSTLPQTWGVCSMAIHTVEECLRGFEVMEKLQSPNLRQRHWKQVARVTGGSIVSDTDLMLGQLLALKLDRHVEQVDDIVMDATREAKIEAQLHDLEQRWARQQLSFDVNLDGCHSLRPPSDILAVLQESLARVQTLAYNPYVLRHSAFVDQVRSLQEQLGAGEALLQVWLQAQDKHSTLSALFSSPSIKQAAADDLHALNQEVVAIDGLDHGWESLMASAAAAPNMVETCADGARYNQVKTLLSRMEEVEARLAAFLQQQRNEFPRGFLLSDAALLQLLSLEGQPTHMQQYLRLCFPGIKELKVENIKGQGEAFTQVVGKHDEALRLVQPVMCSKGAVVAMMLRLHHGIPQAVAATLSATIQAGGQSAWAPTSLLVTSSAVKICNQIEDAWKISGSQSGGLHDLIGLHQEDMDRLVNQLREAKIGGHSTWSIARLVVEQGWWRDVVRGLVDDADTIQDGASCFAWQSQMRFYFAGEGVRVRVGTVEHEYACQWLDDDTPIWVGASTRALVWTLICAHKMRVIPAVCGEVALDSSGTPCRYMTEMGTTDTIQSIGYRMGIQCLTFEGAAGIAACSQKGMEQYVRGAAGIGSWLICTRMTQMPSSMLASLSQLCRYIHDHLRGTASKFLGDGDLALSDHFLLIPVFQDTRQPSELPVSLRAQLRPFTMQAPDPEAILAVELEANGIPFAGKLAARLSRLVVLARNSLSTTSYAGWGHSTMRRIVAAAVQSSEFLSVLNAIMSVNAKTDQSDKDTERIVHGDDPQLLSQVFSMVGNAAISVLESGLVHEDIPLLRQLAAALFFEKVSNQGLVEGENVGGAGENLETLFEEEGGEGDETEEAEEVSETKRNSISVVVNDDKQTGSESRWGADASDLVSSTLIGQCAQDLGLQGNWGFVAKVQQFLAARGSSRSITLLGPASAGKSCIIQTAAAVQKVLRVRTIIRAVNPKSLTARELWGFELRGRWNDGVVAAMLRDLSAAEKRKEPIGLSASAGNPVITTDVGAERDGGEGAEDSRDDGTTDEEQGWLVLDGQVDPMWAEALVPLMIQGGHLVLASGERLELRDGSRLIFETDSLEHASPAWATRSAPVCVSPNDSGWPAHVQTWLKHRESEMPFGTATAVLTKLMGDGPHDIIPSTLSFLQSECKYVFEATEAALVCGVTSILSSIPSINPTRHLDTEHWPHTPQAQESPNAGGLDATAFPTEDAETKERQSRIATMSFIFALVWGLGSAVRQEHRGKLSAWIRESVQEGRSYASYTPLPWANLPALSLTTEQLSSFLN